MPLVEVYIGENEQKPDFVGNFDFLPRTGEYVSRERDDYFIYYQVKEVWFRSRGETDDYQACIHVEIND